MIVKKSRVIRVYGLYIRVLLNFYQANKEEL